MSNKSIFRANNLSNPHKMKKKGRNNNLSFLKSPSSPLEAQTLLVDNIETNEKPPLA